jgi:hypothetical protein
LHSFPVPQLEPGVFPSHAESAPHAAEHVLEHEPAEQENGLQEAKLTHCQNLLQFPEPSHLYCF